MTKSHDIKVTVDLNMPVEKVFKALADAKEIKAWSGQDAVFEPKAGGRFEMFDGWVTGKVVRVKPDKELSYTWVLDGWDADSVVKYKLSPKGDGTEIVIEHTNFPNEQEAKDHKTGWNENFFDLIKEHYGA